MALSTQSRRPVIASRNAAAAERDPALIWLNVGYPFTNDEGEADFVGLDRGIPLDQIADVRGNGFLAQAKNQLRDELLELAHQLEPGEAKLIQLGEDSPLAIQIRRVNPERERVSENNHIAKSLRKLTLV